MPVLKKGQRVQIVRRGFGSENPRWAGKVGVVVVADREDYIFVDFGQEIEIGTGTHRGVNILPTPTGRWFSSEVLKHIKTEENVDKEYEELLV